MGTNRSGVPLGAWVAGGGALLACVVVAGAIVATRRDPGVSPEPVSSQPVRTTATAPVIAPPAPTLPPAPVFSSNLAGAVAQALPTMKDTNNAVDPGAVALAQAWDAKHYTWTELSAVPETKHARDSREASSFISVGSTGTIVPKSNARFCGIVTGKQSYSNSGGGTTHAITLVGMFDLPENRR